MKKVVICIVIIFLISFTPSVNAQQGYGYSTGAYSELGADDTYLERVSDWFATNGKSREEKILIKSRRRAARKMAKTQKDIARKKKEIERLKKKAMEEHKKK